MPIYQATIFVCDKCGETVSRAEEAEVWTDPTIEPMKGWEYLSDDLLCPNCYYLFKTKE